MRNLNHKLMLAGVVAAILLSGCSKKPSATAAPIPFGDDAAVSSVDSSNLSAIDAPVEDAAGADAGGSYLYPDADASPTPAPSAEPSDDAEADAPASTTAELEAAEKAKQEKAIADAAAAEKAAADKKAADEAAAKKAEEKAAAKKKAAEELLVRQTPVFKKAIGEGSLHSAYGIAVNDAGTEVYVVDNARTGLLGKFAAVRVYNVTTGDFARSFENVGWAGAKNLPTSVTAVKLDGANVIASDGSTKWTFGADATLTESVAGSVKLNTVWEDDKTGDTYEIKSGKVVRHDGDQDDDVLVTFGDDELEAPVAVTTDKDGNVYVTESSGKIVIFEAPAE